MQKFTRPITREIELAGERLAVTVGEQGITVRPVGSRRPPREITWPALVCHLTGHTPAEGAAPSTDDLATAVGRLRSTPPASRAAKSVSPSPQASPPPAAEPAAAPASPSVRAPDYTALLARLETWLAHHRPRYLHALRPRADAADLDALQTELGRPLPVGLRTLLSWHNGQSEEFAGGFEGNWKLMSTHAIAEAYKDQVGGGQAAGGWQPAWIPFLDDDGGDYVCLDTSLPDEPVRQFLLGQAEHPVVAPSLAAWLESFVTAVEAGEYVEDPERGAFLRQRHS